MRSFSRQSINPRLRTRSAFTVIELLVAAGVTAILAGILLTMTNGVLRSWNRTTGSLSVNSEAQLIFDILKEDLQSAVFRKDHGVWLAAEILHNNTSIDGRDWTDNTGSSRFKPATAISERLEHLGGDELPLSDARYGLGGTWLRFFTTAGSGEPHAVAYQIARRKITGDPTLSSNPAEARYMLYRSSISPRNTLERGFNLNTNPFPPAPEPDAGYTDPNNDLIVPPWSEVIGNNVIDFGIRLYWTHGGNMFPIFPVKSSGEWGPPPNSKMEYFAYGNSSNPFPDVVDVMVRILTAEGAQMLQNLEEGRIPPEDSGFEETWWAIAVEHSRVFTQRIYLNTRPL